MFFPDTFSLTLQLAAACRAITVLPAQTADRRTESPQLAAADPLAEAAQTAVADLLAEAAQTAVADLLAEAAWMTVPSSAQDFSARLPDFADKRSRLPYDLICLN